MLVVVVVVRGSSPHVSWAHDKGIIAPGRVVGAALLLEAPSGAPLGVGSHVTPPIMIYIKFFSSQEFLALFSLIFLEIRMFIFLDSSMAKALSNFLLISRSFLPSALRTK